MSNATTELRKEIRYDRVTKDYAMSYEGNLIGYAPTCSQAETILNNYVYELLTHGGCETAEALDGGQGDDETPPVDDGPDDNWGGFRSERVIPNDGLHLTQYTVVTSQPGETFSYDLKILCDDCRAKTAGASKMGEVINGFCDACGIGPSVSHFRLVAADPPNPICAACHTDAHPASAMQPAFCTECVNAMLHGRDNRLSGLPVAALADDVPTDNPDIDTTPETEGPSPLRRPRCHCGAVATIWDDVRHLCGPHYLAPVREPDPALGRDLMRLRWHKYASFVATLINAEPERLQHYARSYAAFVRQHNPASTIDASLVLARWAREIEDNGPAAPAMRVAA